MELSKLRKRAAKALKNLRNDPNAAYERTLAHVAQHGIPSEDRTGVGTISTFGVQTRYDLRESFPLITTKRVFWKGVIEELLWFLRGETNVKSLQEAGVRIWDEWADEGGELGPVYGAQWRSWPVGKTHWTKAGKLKGVSTDGIDQIAQVVQEIQKNPNSRRLIVSAWNVELLDYMALQPCHCLFQFYVRNNTLSCQLYQRSADMFLGVPFNIASYAALTHLIARWCDLAVGDFVHTIGDAHIYNNHFEQVAEQLSRVPPLLPDLSVQYVAPLQIPTFADFQLFGYNPLPAIKAEVAV